MLFSCFLLYHNRNIDYIQTMLYKSAGFQEDRQRKMTEGNSHTADPASESRGEKEEERQGVS